MTVDRARRGRGSAPTTAGSPDSQASTKRSSSARCPHGLPVRARSPAGPATPRSPPSASPAAGRRARHFRGASHQGLARTTRPRRRWPRIGEAPRLSQSRRSARPCDRAWLRDGRVRTAPPRIASLERPKSERAGALAPPTTRPRALSAAEGHSAGPSLARHGRPPDEPIPEEPHDTELWVSRGARRQTTRAGGAHSPRIARPYGYSRHDPAPRVVVPPSNLARTRATPTPGACPPRPPRPLPHRATPLRGAASRQPAPARAPPLRGLPHTHATDGWFRPSPSSREDESATHPNNATCPRPANRPPTHPRETPLRERAGSSLELCSGTSKWRPRGRSAQRPTRAPVAPPRRASRIPAAAHTNVYDCRRARTPPASANALQPRPRPRRAIRLRAAQPVMRLPGPLRA
jgi:hypothetical protein